MAFLHQILQMILRIMKARLTVQTTSEHLSATRAKACLIAIMLPDVHARLQHV